MFVVSVDIKVAPQHREAFMQAMIANAHASLITEKGCTQFDVCVSEQNPCRISLYEVYTSAEDFQAHLATSHFLEFDQLTSAWIEEKNVSKFLRAFPHTH